MKRGLRLEPSLCIAVGLVGFVLGGGAVSTALQRWQSRSRLQAAAAEMTGGDPKLGQAVMLRVGCGSCHQIPGVDRADGTVGPSLAKLGARPFLAGRLANEPASLVAWVKHPQSIEPGNGMPDPPINTREARDIAAYLYTLK
jgi:cytochrome c